MATIKISRTKSCSAALDYAAGKDKLNDDTKDWLKAQGVDPEKVNQLSDRAVVRDGFGVDLDYAKPQMKQTRNLFVNRGSTEAMRIIQSFPTDDLNAANPHDWQRCNALGLELAEKIAPNHQVAVYTHLDGEGHKLHNHIIVNMPNLETGKKYHHNHDWQRVAEINNNICREHGLSVPKRTQNERRTMAERQLAVKDEYVWKDDLRSRIDEVMCDTSICDFKEVSERLEQNGVIVHERGQNVSYAFLDANNKQRRARGKSLGTDYEKEVLNHELENRARERAEQTLSKQDEARLTGLVRELKQRESETANADTTLKQRERDLTPTAKNLDRLTIASGRIERKTEQMVTNTKRMGTNFDQWRKRFNDFKDRLERGIEQIKQTVPALTRSVKEHLTSNEFYRDVASRFKADMTKKDQSRRQAIKADLAKRTVPKPQPRHYHNHGGIER